MRNSRVVIDNPGTGAIIAGWDQHSGTSAVYAHKVNAWGIAQWTVNSVAMCESAFDHRDPVGAGDSSGDSAIFSVAT